MIFTSSRHPQPSPTDLDARAHSSPYCSPTSEKFSSANAEGEEEDGGRRRRSRDKNFFAVVEEDPNRRKEAPTPVTVGWPDSVNQQINSGRHRFPLSVSEEGGSIFGRRKQTRICSVSSIDNSVSITCFWPGQKIAKVSMPRTFHTDS